MSDEENYTTIEIETKDMSEAKQLLLLTLLNEGRLRERDRIIEILESLFSTAENAETRRLLTMAIALIKGENK